MLYPLYVHVGDARHAHGVSFPDFPGCFAAADDWEDLPAAVQEAAEAHFAGSETPIPRPTPLESLTASPEFEGGVWMLFDIDLSKLRSKAVRLNISLPERLLQQIDAAARQRRLSRSAFLALAAEHEMERA
ncbi:HicB family protein [Cupriavidus sp. USMAA2-4]|uniref:HicB family protein n=1 Tax=Cupriavidus malaysiensis TaxID=367825 RepID=A0ABN4TDQ0_9BURK|nr:MULTISPECIES: type II toxin-antitoxin system HicB family antitoxin [Cupriavidus]AOY91553.1 HicB family protein [Cupriavidus sp. USMAA2-4]AOY98897.1 HicB family protein [Cupriavidus sp. USMAHM13]AOZ05323.1 HicB family protein [Cupriavidus malaysiensis]